VLTIIVILIISTDSFSKIVHLNLFLQSPTLQISLSFPVNSTAFSKNLSFLHCSRNSPYIKIGSLTKMSNHFLISKISECIKFCLTNHDNQQIT